MKVDCDIMLALMGRVLCSYCALSVTIVCIVLGNLILLELDMG